MTTPVRFAVVAIALLAGLHTSAPHARAQNREVVIQWNEMMQSLHGTGPSSAQRSYSMLHIAIFDAVTRSRTSILPITCTSPARAARRS